MIIILGWHRSVTWNEWILQSRVLRAKRRREDSKYAEENRIQDNDREFYNQGTHSLLTSNNLLASSFTVTCHWSQHCACWKEKRHELSKNVMQNSFYIWKNDQIFFFLSWHTTRQDKKFPLSQVSPSLVFQKKILLCFVLTIVDRWEGGSSSYLIRFHGYIIRSVCESSVVIRS